ncbi:ribulose-phosphate 3-epimerase [Patescibacteria group bacterium]
MKIIPAIIPKSYEDLESKLSLVKGLVPLVQIDILDGIFVPEKSWPFGSEKEEIPFKQDFGFELDLMIEKPEESLDYWISLGAKRIIIHLKSTSDFNEIYRKLKFNNIEVGLAVSPETTTEEITEYLEKIDFIQFMGIKKIGFQGSPFDERVINKISNLRSINQDVTISVDGGVSLENAESLVQSGANRLVSGSTIFKSGDISETIKKFEEILNKNV